MEAPLIACPMAKEAEALNHWFKGRLVAVGTGLGIKRTVPALLKRFRSAKPALLIFSGSAAQLDLSLAMGDVVLPCSWSFEAGPSFDCDGELTARLEEKGWSTRRRGLTMEGTVLRSEQRAALFQSTGAAISDSVTAAVLRVCKTSGIPCLTPKIVASTVDSGLLTFWKNLEKNIRPLADGIVRLLDDLG